MFLINRGELDERLDVEYYQPSHFELLAKLLACRYPVKLLKNVSQKIVDGPFGSAVKANDYVENGIPFLRVADITHGDGTIELDDLIYISPKKHQEISRSTVFPNDVVIAKTGATMGAASVVPETIKEANIRGDLAAVIVNDTAFANYIVNFINTKIGQDLFWRLNSGATRGRVVISNLRKYPVVVPDDEKIKEINECVNYAKIRKNKKLAEATALLASIDGYLLQELGITLPTPSEKKTFFYTNFNKVSGGRFDALSHQTDIFSDFKTSKFNLVAIKEITNYLKTGFAAGKQDQDLEEIGIIQIRPTNVKEPERNLTFDRNIYIKSTEVVKRTSDLLQRNEILFNNTNSQELVGKTTLFNLEGDYFCSNHMTRISVNQKVDSFYLTLILNLYQHLRVFYRMCVNWNNQSGVNTEMLRNIKIPLPPLAKQTEIANHINAIRQQAKQLQQQAQTELEQAKQQVERLILGVADI